MAPGIFEVKGITDKIANVTIIKELLLKGVQCSGSFWRNTCLACSMGCPLACEQRAGSGELVTLLPVCSARCQKTTTAGGGTNRSVAE